MLSAVCFNLDQFKIVSSVNRLSHLTKDPKFLQEGNGNVVRNIEMLVTS